MLGIFYILFYKQFFVLYCTHSDRLCQKCYIFKRLRLLVPHYLNGKRQFNDDYDMQMQLYLIWKIVRKMEAGYQTEIQYLLVLDFEATCIENKKLQPCSEIIEFPVIVVDTRTCKKLDVFHQYVKPHYHPQLTPFCINLTGIKQQMVDPCKKLQEVLQNFDEWIKSLKYLKEGNFTFVTCGDWDLTNCLRNQAKSKKIFIPAYLREYINIKKYFVKILNQEEKSKGMMDMINILKIEHEGRHHSGIDDVTNICNICIELIKNYKAIFPKKEINKIKM